MDKEKREAMLEARKEIFGEVEEASRCYICDVKFERGVRGGRQKVVHHIISKRLGGKNEKENLIAICSGCHGKIHSRYNRDALLYMYKKFGKDFFDHCIMDLSGCITNGDGELGYFESLEYTKKLCEGRKDATQQNNKT